MTYTKTLEAGLKAFDEKFKSLENKSGQDSDSIIVDRRDFEAWKKVTRINIKEFMTSFAEKVRESTTQELSEKIEKMKYPQSVIDEYDEFNSRDEAMDKGNTIGFNSALSNLLAQLKDK